VPETLSYQIDLNCPISADVRHAIQSVSATLTKQIVIASAGMNGVVSATTLDEVL